MDGFYDQQVPFMVPGVSFCGFWFVLSSLFKFQSSPYWFSNTTPFQVPLFLHLSLHCLPFFQKSRSEECRGRPVTDRKRKFLDTDLAHDSEGSKAFPSVLWLPQVAPRESCTEILPFSPNREILIVVSSVLNSRVVSGSQSTSRGLVSWRQVSWLAYFSM